MVAKYSRSRRQRSMSPSKRSNRTQVTKQDPSPENDARPPIQTRRKSRDRVSFVDQRQPQQQSDEERIATLSRIAWSYYKEREYVLALTQYNQLLKFTNSPERGAIYVKVNANILYRKGMCYECIGDLGKSMDCYCDALKLYKLCKKEGYQKDHVDQDDLPAKSTAGANWSLVADDLDQKLSIVLEQMANVQMKLGNKEFAVQLYTSAYKRLKAISNRQEKNAPTSIKGERQSKFLDLIKHMVDLLRNIMDIQVMRGDYEAANQARTESQEMQKRLEFADHNDDQYSMASTLRTKPEYLPTMAVNGEELITNISQLQVKGSGHDSLDEIYRFHNGKRMPRQIEQMKRGSHLKGRYPLQVTGVGTDADKF